MFLGVTVRRVFSDKRYRIVGFMANRFLLQEITEDDRLGEDKKVVRAFVFMLLYRVADEQVTLGKLIRKE